MKKPAVVFITLFVVFNISGIICNPDDICKSINDRCASDCDCCYQKCSFSIFSFRSYCNDNTNFYNFITSYFSSEEQNGTCSYDYTPENKTISDGLYLTYGLNAAHAVLPAGTKVEVTVNNKKLIVTINNRPSKKDGVILEFSKQTAEALDVRKSGSTVLCKLFVPTIENNTYYKFLTYAFPYLSLFSLLLKLL